MTETASYAEALPTRRSHGLNLPLTTPFKWIAAGFADTFRYPFASLAYGMFVVLISWLLIGVLFKIGADYIIFPALSGFMVMGPAIAVGLYEKSRRLESGEPVSLPAMILVKARSPGQIMFVGVIMMLVLILWLRAAVLLYALFFGMLPFPGLAEIVQVILTTPLGWGLLAVGTATGGLFAAFAFAISAFSIPMLMNERIDVFTAMGTSIAFSWANRGVAFVWGAIIAVLFAVGVATALIGLIVIYPALGHAAWHAYRAVTQGKRLFDTSDEAA
ncbi:MAG: DUF2189 domain-containing protein [Parvularculaceae bacterium]